MTDPISEDAVEAAALAMALLSNHPVDMTPLARAALTAARPLMEAEAVWEGPFTDPTALDSATRQGDVVVDDVGIYRQRRYPNSVMGGGYTSHGCGPLTASDLLENGKRPAWVLRAKSPAATIAERTTDDST